MKKFIRNSWMIFCIILLAVFIVSCFSAYISPEVFGFMPLFAIAFPYFFLSVLIAGIINLFIKRSLAFIMLACMLLFGYKNITATIAFNLPAKTSLQKDSATLRLITWNVQHFVDFMNRPATAFKMLQLIAEKNADIVCVQEFTNVEGSTRYFSIRKKMDSLGYRYYFNAEDDVNYFNKDTGFFMRGSAIFSKMPFTDSGRININNRDIKENLIYVDIAFNNKPLRIYTAHLESFALYTDTQHIEKDIYEITYSRKRTIQHKLRDVELFHQHEAEIIHAAIATARMPVIYCGDMNAVPSSYTYHILKNNFQDAFIEKGSGIGATFYKVLPLLRIDYCLAGKQLDIISCAVIQQKLSDHYPVITDMQWK